MARRERRLSPEAVNCFLLSAVCFLPMPLSDSGTRIPRCGQGGEEGRRCKARQNNKLWTIRRRHGTSLKEGRVAIVPLPMNEQEKDQLGHPA
jgi:hypothetical protein